MREWVIRAVSRIYALWTRIYNKGERKKYSNIKIKKYNGTVLPEAAWNQYTRSKNLKWQKDTIWMLWDVISIPRAVIARGGDDCIPFYEKIYMADGSAKTIKDICVGDKVLSYDFNKKELVSREVIAHKNTGSKDVYRVNYKNGTFTDFSKTHKILTKTYQGDYKETRIEDLDLKEFTPAQYYKKKVPTIKRLPYVVKDIKGISKDICFLIGYFLAEGYVYQNRSGKGFRKVQLGGHDIPEHIQPILDKNNIPYSLYVRPSDSLPIVTFLKGSNWREYLGSLVFNSFNTTIPEELKWLPESKLQSILDGYFLGDGHSRRNEKTYTTSSDNTKEFLCDISLKLGRPLLAYLQRSHGGVGKSPIWRLSDCETSYFRKDYGFIDLSESSIKSIQKQDEVVEMYDITVKDTHNFIMVSSNSIVHNCDGFARLGHSFFGERITIGKQVYNFQGLASLIFTKMPYHIIAIYKCGNTGKYITISNHHFFYHVDLNALVAHYDNRYGDGKLVRYMSMFKIVKEDVYFNHLIDLKKQGVYHG